MLTLLYGVVLFLQQHLTPGGQSAREAGVVTVILVVLTSMMAFVPLLSYLIANGTGPVKRFLSCLTYSSPATSAPTAPLLQGKPYTLNPSFFCNQHFSP